MDEPAMNVFPPEIFLSAGSSFTSGLFGGPKGLCPGCPSSTSLAGAEGLASNSPHLARGWEDTEEMACVLAYLRLKSKGKVRGKKTQEREEESSWR